MKNFNITHIFGRELIKKKNASLPDCSDPGADVELTLILPKPLAPCILMLPEPIPPIISHQLIYQKLLLLCF